jgi:hypothetical protein
MNYTPEVKNMRLDFNFNYTLFIRLQLNID